MTRRNTDLWVMDIMTRAVKKALGLIYDVSCSIMMRKERLLEVTEVHVN